MPDEKDKTSEKEKADEPTRYSRDQLIAESRALLKVAPHVAVGALHGEEGDEFELKDARGAVRKFLGRKVVKQEAEAA